MKIFYQDLSWCGSITVVANTKEEAIRLMEDCPNYESDHDRYPIQEHEIVPGLVLHNTGDM